MTLFEYAMRAYSGTSAVTVEAKQGIPLKNKLM